MIQTLQLDAATVSRKSIIECMEVFVGIKDVNSYRAVIHSYFPYDEYSNPISWLELLKKTLPLGIKEYRLSLGELAILGGLVQYAKDFKLLPEDYCVEVVWT